ncbi:protein tyrosine phosphatase family protein [Sulfurimonas sp.]|uniref:protein tyrosine phosphatase family protein n=1 Tax=Sulfurimonas sp. TaxID=2022749 RepID=UPI003D0DC0C4
MKNILNYIKVNDTISTSGQPTKEQFKAIAKEGFDVVINLAMHNRGALKEEDKIVSKNNMVYYHIPITWEKPEIERLELFLATLKMLQKQNKKVFIHCIKNYRASVFVYKYKKHILKEKDTQLIAPKGYKPNEVWQKVMKAKI